MCGIARGKHEFIQTGFNLQILISKWNPQQSNTQKGHLWIKVDYEQTLFLRRA